jgi:L-rhamnose mutarotase
MSKHRVRQAACLAVALAVGIVVGYLCGEAARTSASAAAAGDKGPSEARPAAAPAMEKLQRFGSVIGLKPGKADEYIRLHAAVWPQVLATIRQCNIRNYSIYLGKLDDGNLYLFGYFEYTGHDFQADMKKMADDPATQRWWKLTDPCQVPQMGRKPGEHWMTMREVFHVE